MNNAVKLDTNTLRRLAGPRSFERGESYFEDGRVGSLVEDKGKITAFVHGSSKYRVKLWNEDGNLEYECSCPVGQDGDFCKHCVAVGLTWLAGNEIKETNTPSSGSKVTFKDIRSFLLTQDKEVLTEMILDQAAEDVRLRNKLLLQAAGSKKEGTNLTAYRQAIDNAVNPDGYVSYYEMYDYSQGIDEVVSSISELLKRGKADVVIELCEYALRKVEKALNHVDDSDGHMGGILERLQELHLSACKKAKPDQEALAKRLFDWEISGEWDTFYGAVKTYSEVLGKKGLDIYRQLAEEEWKKIKPLGPADKDSDRYGRRFRVTHIMEDLAKQSGDIEALVAIKSRDLSNSYAFLNIAEAYKESGNREMALDWAERGLKAFPQKPDSRLMDFVAEEYHRQNPHDEAMKLIWRQFEASHSFHTYDKLKTHADKTRDWPVWREKALKAIREDLKRNMKVGKSPWMRGHNHSLLVEIFLFDKDADAAWKEANDGGCSDSLWLRLAEAREKHHPNDAIAAYQRMVNPIVDRKNNGAYEEATKLILKIKALMARTSEETKFASYLNSIKAAHKPKRNFMKLMERIKS